MLKKHQKSPCCQGSVKRIGARRRQCLECNKTWSTWKRKRGRKKLRVSSLIAKRFVLARRLPTRCFDERKKRTRNKNQYRLAKSRTKCADDCPWPAVPPKGSLIVVADALVKYVERKWYTWYFILVRGIDDTRATILPPFYLQGTETVRGWKLAFDHVEQAVLQRMVALVSDGHRGLIYEAKWRGWHIQRCHFHLIARLQSRRSKWKTSRHFEEGNHIYALVKKALDEPWLNQNILNELEEISWTNRSPEIRSVLAGFVNHVEEYRTYLAHQELQLPTTNNTAETTIGLVEEVCRRARGFKTVLITNEWIMVVVKTRKSISCAPKKIKEKTQN